MPCGSGGLLLPLPLVIGSLASQAFRADVRRLNRFLPGDVPWLRSGRRRSGAFPSGKFNAGQKLNSAFTVGTLLVLLGTGLMLRCFSIFPDDIRTGATFVHDAFAAAAGHLWMAWQDPEARRGLRTGRVSREWAVREHALWAATVPMEPEPEPDGDPGAPVPAP